LTGVSERSSAACGGQGGGGQSERLAQRAVIIEGLGLNQDGFDHLACLRGTGGQRERF
jgi:hypothetical protein